MKNNRIIFRVNVIFKDYGHDIHFLRARFVENSILFVLKNRFQNGIVALKVSFKSESELGDGSSAKKSDF